MRHGHPWFAGQAGPRGNRVASRLTKEADVMVVLGARLGFNSTFHSHDYVGAETRIAHVDIEGSAVGRYFPAEIVAQGDARLTAEALTGVTARPPCEDCAQHSVPIWQALPLNGPTKPRWKPCPCTRAEHWQRSVGPCPKTPS